MLLQLDCGHDFFGDGYGDRHRGTVPDVATMREHWQDPEIRRRVQQRRPRDLGKILFADIAFGPDGTSGVVQTEADYGAAMREYWRQEEAARRRRQERHRSRLRRDE
jgi:hypothetical protein